MKSEKGFPETRLFYNGEKTIFKIIYDADFECYMVNIGNLNAQRFNAEKGDLAPTIGDAKAILLEVIRNYVSPEMLFSLEFAYNNGIIMDPKKMEPIIRMIEGLNGERTFEFIEPEG